MAAGVCGHRRTGQTLELISSIPDDARRPFPNLRDICSRPWIASQRCRTLDCSWGRCPFPGHLLGAASCFDVGYLATSDSVVLECCRNIWYRDIATFSNCFLLQPFATYIFSSEKKWADRLLRDLCEINIYNCSYVFLVFLGFESHFFKATTLVVIFSLSIW